MRVKGALLIAFILLLPLNNIFAEGIDKKARLRYQAMEQEMDKLAARREKAMEEAMRPQFFFIQKPSLSLLALRQNPLMLR